MKKTILIISVLFLLFGVSFASGKGGNKTKTPKNIILMIGDGMGLAQIHAAMTTQVENLNMLLFPVCGLVKTNSADEYITDSAAGATAMSTGVKTRNGYVAMDTLGNKLQTILELAEENGLSTGLIATSSITHATPACFIAHQPDRNMMEEIAGDFLKTNIDVFIGGGLKYFSKRKDKTDLVQLLKDKGYEFYTSLDEINKTPEKFFVLTADEHNKKISDGRGDMLSNATQKALDVLSQNNDGFFLMIEGSQIDWGGHDNNKDYVISELLDFDKTVGIAKDFAKKNGETLVIVTGDHETGGMVVIDGNYGSHEVKCSFATTNHTGILVPLFAYGPGAVYFTGFYENTEIFYKMKKLLGL